ncbi:MAG: peptide chain release factor 1 [Clostridia bacterium]|nr:peptide chain release factor 1 [Clostridia bacterium]
MFEKLKQMRIKLEELNKELEDPNVYADQKRYQKIAKEHAELVPIIEKFEEYEKVQRDMQDAEEMRKSETDADMIAMLEEEYYADKEKLVEIEKELKILLLPKDENDEKNVIIEIRAGAGGDEAGLFGAELKRMYGLFADAHGYTIEELDGNYTEAGGIKEVTFMVKGKGAFSKLKFESGVHRVQRVPETESQGRVHTSTATVAVLPEATNVEIDINEKDLQIDTYRSGGAGGQHVNKTESAIRITHIPTGIIVACQDERSQIKNKEKAMNWLKAKLYDFYQSQADKEYAEKRKLQVGTGDRSEKIRTYNFPQNRITDHRINLTLYSLDSFMNGNIDEMLEALQIAHQQALLSANEE